MNEPSRPSRGTVMERALGSLTSTANWWETGKGSQAVVRLRLNWQSTCRKKLTPYVCMLLQCTLRVTQRGGRKRGKNTEDNLQLLCIVLIDFSDRPIQLNYPCRKFWHLKISLKYSCFSYTPAKWSKKHYLSGASLIFSRSIIQYTRSIIQLYSSRSIIQYTRKYNCSLSPQHNVSSNGYLLVFLPHLFSFWARLLALSHSPVLT